MTSAVSSKAPSRIHLSPVLRLLIGVALSSVSAVLLTFSMPPYGIWPLAVLGLLPMVLAQYRVFPRRLSGLAMAITIGGLVGLYIMDAFLSLGNAPWYMRGLPFIFGVVILFTDAGTRAFHERTDFRWFVLSGALGWMGVEMIRSLIPVLGTWGFIGYAYFKHPWLIQPASIFGIFGMGLVTMLLSFGLGRAMLAWFDSRWRLEDDVRPVDPQTSRRWLLGTGAAYGGWAVLSLVMLWVP